MELYAYDGVVGVVVAFLVGASVGSFASLASYRLPRDIGVVRKPSMCPSCEATLRPRDLLPILSWLMAGGKCRHCAALISVRYPLMETLLGGAFAGLFLHYGWSAQGVLLALFLTTLLVMVVADLETYILPDETQLALLMLGVGYHVAVATPYAVPLGGLAFGVGVGLALHFGYRAVRKRDGLGLGDVKLFAVAGVWLGVEGLAPFFLLAGVLGIVTALIWRALSRGERFPFGPALAISLGVCVLFPSVPSRLLQLMAL